MVGDEVRKVTMDLAEELKKLYKDKLKAVILYGSEVRGTAQEDSDIDILVLVDVEPEELRSYEDALSDISTEFALEFFKVFSIIDVSFKEFSKWKDVSPFYKNVAREGVILYAMSIS
ncbi:hypothetical protein PMF13cell1_03641 [Blautia producta]|uniref:Polymerase nucleotidyl transferase domain-containing protein n=1 Tax=Blautia producta TaxID=33035 RepID=A0A4P6M3Y9_9FIRM|nr:nucleotidyltransferase domain-containing protein [Blautia producta]QBE98077.1 hypothetical protein PMF13cell1_03641 [Blautia producta]